MKAILINQKPKQVANILNGKQTIIILKQFPKDYCGWVYIYCAKDKSNNLHKNRNGWFVNDMNVIFVNDNPIYDYYNSKVVAKFMLNKIGLVKYQEMVSSETIKTNELTCLTDEELEKYLGKEDAYALYIDNLVIFDKPKELSEFEHETKTRDTVRGYIYDIKPVSKAPSTYCYVFEEVE